MKTFDETVDLNTLTLIKLKQLEVEQRVQQRTGQGEITPYLQKLRDQISKVEQEMYFEDSL